MKKLIIFIFFILLAGLYACNKCQTKDRGKYYFTTIEKTLIPYTGNETLSFKSSTGDSIGYIGTGRDITMNVIDSGWNDEQTCPSARWSVEEHRTVYWDNNTVPESGHSKQYCGVYIGKNPFGYNDFSVSLFFFTPIHFYFNSNGHYLGNTLYCSENEIMTPIDSLTINDRTYYIVYRFNRATIDNICDTSSKPPCIYYTLDKGIVGFQTSDNQWWNLNE
jgi:hypothetical protein